MARQKAQNQTKTKITIAYEKNATCSVADWFFSTELCSARNL